MSRDQAMDMTNNVMEDLLQHLSALGISPPPPQQQNARALNFTDIDLSDQSLPLASIDVSRRDLFCETLRSHLVQLQTTVRETFAGLLLSWRGSAPEDNFELIASSFERYYHRQACLLRDQAAAAIERASRARATGPRVSAQASCQDMRTKALYVQTKVVFDDNVKAELERCFAINFHPKPPERRRIARRVGLTYKQVTTWVSRWPFVLLLRSQLSKEC